ncbi:MAG TPA: hypothetical protein VFI13_03805 [Gemmatimonadales bacterium]|nr:hypothetical protein [Gemmatimonadales bacterium]
MIAFATLLLGLISGVYPIEVAVSGPVAAVEFLLDGAEAGRIEQPPWIAKVDLGSDLRPHELVARALDAQGNELSRVTQWINLPRPPAEVEVVLENDGRGAPRAARLTWQSVSGVNPTSIALTLDGEPLTVDGSGRAALPPRDLGSLHVLSADLWFPPGVTARRDVAYGGQYGSEVSTELTAVPVRVRPGASLPPPAGLAGWLTAGGQPLTAAAVENGAGKVIVVRVPAAQQVLDKLLPGARQATLPFLKGRMRLGPQDRVRFLSLTGSPYRDSKVPAELFGLSRELTPEDGGLLWCLTSFHLLKEPRGREKRVADAVAVAGLQAAADNDRRAVVLVVGRNDPDASRYTPAAVRRYLAAIHVPLFVWSLYGADTPAARAWTQGGEPATDISTVARLEAAVARLKAEMADQTIVWLDGRHLPQAIELGPQAKGVEIVTP